ncbi:hypothetical protein OIU80_02250 [Flavobacterium sp. LS1R47]|uniref:Lipoprotein n=1 Tax=Flavobacterium frigoritolerans TaxID=2987686 RepID=A0A9X3C0N2_9FLAO|nr:hypothetical protein [Flavobacterium frigoritolerans]MCV9931091.1 hypothetical protein [Flavobacterium frigoritolerans]
MKKYFSFFLLIILFTSCQVTETISLNADGSGTINVVQLRDEHSYMLSAGEKYSKEEQFKDTAYVFQDYITKYNETFFKYTQSEQQLFQKYANVKVHVKKSSFDKEFKTIITFPFTKIDVVPNLYNTEDYANDLENNYALTAEKHFFDVQYSFDGTVFKRTLNVINEAEIEKNKNQIKDFKSKTHSLDLTLTYSLKYNFPRRIKSVSNAAAILSSDKKSLTLTLQLLDCLQDPASTNLEVVLE